jgi:hypothetical protein
VRRESARRAKGAWQTAALALINRRAAGLDIGSRFHVVAVPAELDAEPVRSFQSFTGDLNRLAEWLVGLGMAVRPPSCHRHARPREIRL